MKIIELINKLVNLGVTETIPLWEAKKIRVLNILCLFTLFAQFNYALVFAYKDILYLSWNNAFLFFFMAVIIYLNYIGKYSLARGLYAFVTFDLLLFTYLFGEIGAEYVQIIIITSSLFFYSINWAILLSFIATLNFIIAKLFIHTLSFPDIGFAKTLFHVLNLGFTFIYTFIFVYLYKEESERQNKEIFNKTIDLEAQAKELIRLNEAKDKFFSLIAHDLRNPIGGIHSMHKILLEDYDDISKKEMKEYLEGLSNSSDQAFQLLENLLKWSISQRGLIPFHPNKLKIYLLARDIILLLSQAANMKSIRIHNTIPEDLEIVADSDLISTVLRNLITNSIKFTTRGGEIIIGCEINQKNSEFTFCVQDNGIGIPESSVNKLFKIDYKVTRQGTEGESSSGLGLIMCKEFIEKHNGNIWVESLVGQGTKIFFTIPNFQN